jgi:hypothetical protein
LAAHPRGDRHRRRRRAGGHGVVGIHKKRPDLRPGV